MIIATPFSAPVTYHGEGAVWAHSWGGLRCVDMLHGDVLHFDAHGIATRHHLGTIAAMIRPATPGVSLVARESDVVLWEESSGRLTTVANNLVPDGGRLNEGTCTPQGELLIGSLAQEFKQDGGRLMKVSPFGAAVVLPSVTVSNGIGFSPDGTCAYYVDSPTYRLDVFTVTESGDLIERRPLAEFDPARGAPDGLWVDEEGGIWLAMFGGSRVQRVLADGTLDLHVSVEARQVTSCTFGGPELSTLYITTSRENLDDGDDPLAGSVFHADVGISGLPVLTFTPDAQS
ncbi:MAG TPA: SMP-30/gluconolactonase/LRE family protein [Terrimesophilobacter sp.]|nr:SMP-30/gluconolactonase/LRE family protein [Terrimesophilobacter sp.]HRP99108.1 SMP-30/gluconolactonase/LRE family protein [Terrimesophilobacter sp.]